MEFWTEISLLFEIEWTWKYEYLYYHFSFVFKQYLVEYLYGIWDGILNIITINLETGEKREKYQMKCIHLAKEVKQIKWSNHEKFFLKK